MVQLESFGASVAHAANRAAKSDVPVLLSGDTGCGKTVLASLIHQASNRAGRPFLRADCASIPESLFEREMFGHTRGSFTDAKESQPGLFEAAEGGTLFLDEIGELPLSIQPKLLSVLDDGFIRRIGSTKCTRVDVRILAATNRDLAEMVKLRQFRADLYYRLAFLRIHIPPLRERASSIPVLAETVLHKLSARRWLNVAVAPALHPLTLECLRAYDWPGNIRELEHALTFAATYFEAPVILPEHLPPEVRERRLQGRAADSSGTGARYKSQGDRQLERAIVIEALESCQGNRTRAAKALGMSRATLWIRLREFGLAAMRGEPTAR